ncbi:MAG: hypothetical protein FVQ79_09480 [Planctomycetes bacterium]|nr:hypothetical protein [Planctomycetota bacterium]
MKKILLILSVFVFVGFFCVGCKKTADEVPQETDRQSQNTEAVSDQGAEDAVSDQGVEDASEDLVIRPGIGVGKIKFGMTVKQMKDILGKPDVDATGISFLYSDLGIEIVAKDMVTVSAISCGNPFNKDLPLIRAMEEACKFKTVEGIGIGSTEDQVLKAFGQPTKRSNDRLRYKGKRMSIHLANGKVIGMWIQ